MFTTLLSKGLPVIIKYCQIRDISNSANIWKEGTCYKLINIAQVKAHLSKFRGFQKKISF